MNLERRAGSGELLHQVPQPGKGFLLHRPQRKNRRVQKELLRRHARRLPSGRKNFGDESGQAARQFCRRAGDHYRRESDVRRHRPSHLQRLHEVLHLPEAGPCRHPAGRNAGAERCSGTPLGLRNLQPAHALESAELRAAGAERRIGIQSSGRRPRPRRIHALASPDERRPHGRRCRRAEDRAFAIRNLRRHARMAITSRSVPSATSTSSTNPSTTA